MFTRRHALLSFSAALLLAAGCGDNAKTADSGDASSPAAGGGAKATIAVIPKGLTHVFWQSVRAGAERAGKEFGVEIKWDGPQKESDQAGQIAVVENAINSKVDGIVLAPLDKAALVGVIKKANEAKIPLTVFDSAADVGEEAYVSFVATDNKKGGVLAAERMGKLLNGKGKVALIPNQANSASTLDRESGFEETLKAKFPGITLVKANLANSDRQQAMRVTEDVLTANPDIVGIFGSCEPCAVGALQAVKTRGLVGKVKLVGFDITNQLEDAVAAGEMDSLVLQNPERMGYDGVKSIVDSKAGKTVEKRIDTGVVLLTKENMETPEIKALRPPRGQM